MQRPNVCSNASSHQGRAFCSSPVFEAHPCPYLQQILEDHTILRLEVLPTGDNGVNLPVNLKRLIWNAQQLFKVKPKCKAPSGASNCSCLPLGLQLSACSHVLISRCGLEDVVLYCGARRCIASMIQRIN